MRNVRLIVIALLFSSLSLSAEAAVLASLDRSQVGAGEAVQLTLQHDGQTDSQPDLGALKQDFDIVGRSTGSSIQIVNGKMSAQTQLNLTLMPKHGGKIVIPALQWGSQASPALTLTVGGSSASAQPGNAASAGNAHVFIVTSMDQKQPYVQAAVTLTVKLYVDEPLYQASLELQPNNDVLIQQLGKDKQTSESYHGREYQMVERKYLLFPQRSGAIKLDGPVLEAQVPDSSNADPFAADPFFGNAFGHNPFAGMMNATRPIRIRGDQLALDVRPRPAANANQDWLPAQNVTLTETLQPASGTFHAGDPVTLHLHLEALGLTASQLPDLSQLLTLPSGLRAYPDQAKLNDNVQGSSVLGTRDQDIAIIASQSGRYVIPAMHLYWWDTAKNVQRRIDLAAHTLEILSGAAGASAGTAPPAPRSADSAQSGATASPRPANPATAIPSNYLWPLISLALTLLWLGTMFYLWRKKRRGGPMSGQHKRQEPILSAMPDSNQARNAFQQACRENDPQTARRQLLLWAHSTWPDDPPLGIKSIAARLGESDLESLLQQLDRACYTGSEWQGQPLLEALQSLSGKGKPAARTAAGLAPLYP